ncbi:MAG: TIGR03905 family TSCPD domain-containing protein [Firmicutes bacterium]|nr:TIGR03905 family TSCPD domain-containing protein [Clostridiales bacterium]MBQ9931009.1 TIGR03905 family TSCPD domain-containing protein [Bacillota bacterium]
MRHNYKTVQTCADRIDFDLEDGIVTNIVFHGGCNGNLKAIAHLVDGMSAEQIIEKCKGNTCGLKKTSCVDQLAKALEGALQKEQ